MGGNGEAVVAPTSSSSSGMEISRALSRSFSSWRTMLSCSSTTTWSPKNSGLLLHVGEQGVDALVEALGLAAVLEQAQDVDVFAGLGLHAEKNLARPFFSPSSAALKPFSTLL